MSALAVSNDVLLASLRPPAPPSLGSWLEQRAVEWFPTFERWQIRALDCLAERALWQRCAISAALGALLGLGAVSGVAAAFLCERAEVAAAALMPHALERAVARVALPAPSAVPRQTVPGQVIEDQHPSRSQRSRP
jgi:hypothetical protein